MAAPSKESGDFNLLITEVDPDRASDAARELAAAFSLDETIAGQVVHAAPIVFADRLTKSEVKAVTAKLVELSKAGITFRVTARLAAKVPKLHWPVRPQFTAAGSGSAVGLAFNWNNNAFVCPSCGESYLFRAMGQVALVEPPESKSSESGIRAAIAPAQPEPASRPVAPAPATKTVPVVEEETLDFADVAPLEPDEENPLAGVEDVAPLVDSEDPPALDLEPVEATEGNGASAGETAVEEDASFEGELYNVFLSKIAERSRQDEAAKLIVKTKGCSPAEAKELSSRLVIPIAKNIPKEKAETILSDFKKIKVFGRMTKAK